MNHYGVPLLGFSFASYLAFPEKHYSEPFDHQGGSLGRVILLSVTSRFVSFFLCMNGIAGDVELSNMQLKPEALNALKLPVKVKAGFLGSVKLKVGNSDLTFLWS